MERIATMISNEMITCDEQDSFYYLDNDEVTTLFESLVHCRTSANNMEECRSYLSRKSL